MPADAPAGSRALVTARLGAVVGEAGEDERAEALLEEAVDLAAAADRTDLEAGAFNDLGNLRMRGRPIAALESYTQAAALAERAGLPRLRVRALINAARAERLSGETGNTAALLRQATGLLDAMPAGQNDALERLAAAGAGGGAGAAGSGLPPARGRAAGAGPGRQRRFGQRARPELGHRPARRALRAWPAGTRTPCASTARRPWTPSRPARRSSCSAGSGSPDASWRRRAGTTRRSPPIAAPCATSSACGSTCPPSTRRPAARCSARPWARCSPSSPISCCSRPAPARARCSRWT